MTPTTPTTVLLIEDSPSDVRLVEELLHQSSPDSFKVITASTLAKGLELLSHNSVDVVLLDLGLPDSQGIATFHAVYKHAPHLPIVVFTVSDDEALGQRVLQEGALRFLSKDVLTLGAPYARIFTRMIGYVIEQKRVKEANRASEEQLATLFESSPIVQIRYDPEGVPIVANRAAREFLGISDVSAIHRLSIFTSPRVSDADKARLRAGKPTRYEQTYDFDLIKQQGGFPTTRSGVRYVDFFLAPIFDKDGVIEAYLAQIVDITERKHAEDALQETHEEVQVLNEELQSTNKKLRIANEGLEQRVQERTEELASTNEELRALNEELRHETQARTKAERAAQTHARYLDILNRVIRAGNEAATLHAALAAMVSTALELTDLDSGVVFLLNDAEGVTELQYEEGYPADRVEQIQGLPLSLGSVAPIYRGEPVFMEDYQKEERPEYVISGMASAIGIPLIAGEQIIGHYGAMSARPRHFTKKEREMLITLGREAGTVIARMQTHAALTHELAITETITRLTPTLLFPSLDLNGLMLAILDDAKRLTGSAHGFVGLIDPRTKDLIGYGHTQMLLDECNIPEAQRQVRFPIGADGRYHGLWGHPLNEQHGFFTNAPAEHPAAAGIPEGHAALGQFLAVPALVSDEVVGEIALANPGRDYTQRDLAVVGRLAQELLALGVMRMRAEEQLRNSSRYARNLIEASLDPLVTISAEGTITDVNKATEEVTGYSRAELIDSDFSDYFTEPAKARAGYKQVFADGFVTDYPLTIRHKSGKVTEVLYNATLYRDEAGEVQGVFAAARDVTERKRAEEELQRYSGHLESIVEERTAQLKDAERLAGIGETAAMIGHDLRNPLQGLQYIVDLQKLRFERMPSKRRDTDDWDKEQELFDRISEQVFYMDKIVGDLQDYARPIKPEHEEILLRTILDDALRSLPSAGGVEISLDVGDLIIDADPHFMHRVFANLILNAIQAMPDGGTLTIHATADDGSVAVSLRDTGVGIPPDMFDKLFSPLATGKAKGTGLGLAVVKRIVEAHNGTITFESEEGKGTTFTVTLPQTAE